MRRCSQSHDPDSPNSWNRSFETLRVSIIFPDALDDEHIEADNAILFVRVEQAEHAPVRLTESADDRARLGFVVVELERAERRAARSDGANVGTRGR